MAVPAAPRVAALPSDDDPLGQKIIGLSIWAVREGLRSIDAAPLFDDLCRRLIDAGLRLWRATAGTRTALPQWGGYRWPG